MKHYKSPKNEVFAYEKDGSQDYLIPSDYVPISESEADALRQAKYQSDFEALSYSQKRQAEYPPISDYLDGVVKGDQNQINAYIAACQAVKAKYPKPV